MTGNTEGWVIYCILHLRGGECVHSGKMSMGHQRISNSEDKERLQGNEFSTHRYETYYIISTTTTGFHYDYIEKTTKTFRHFSLNLLLHSSKLLTMARIVKLGIMQAYGFLSRPYKTSQ